MSGTIEVDIHILIFICVISAIYIARKQKEKLEISCYRSLPVSMNSSRVTAALLPVLTLQAESRC